MASQRDMSGTMGFHEFRELSQVLNGWKQHFVSFDRDHSGTVEGQEMQQAIASLGTYGFMNARARAADKELKRREM